MSRRRHDRTARIGTLTVTEALDRVEVDEAGPGELIGVSGIDDVTIGDTLADPDDPRPFPSITVDEPTLSMTIGVNTSPLAGQDGKKLTARLIKGRLDAELIGNVSMRVAPTERPDTWEVQGRGELQLAILVETMRREGFELTVGKPEVLTREIDGKLHEPTERLTIDVPEEHVGAVTQLLGSAQGPHGQHGRTTAPAGCDSSIVVPARALIGFRTEFLTETRGTGMLHHMFEGYDAVGRRHPHRRPGRSSPIAPGESTGYAIDRLQERASLYRRPGAQVYEGMIVGENSRSEDMDVNICQREEADQHAHAVVRRHDPTHSRREMLSLEQALEFIADDECVEVTPQSVRIRKTVLDAGDRARIVKRLKAPRDS